MENIDKEMLEGVIAVAKDVAEDIIRPTSQSIGSNIGLLVDGVMGWVGYWGEKQKIKRELYLSDYKSKITKKILEIPEENLVEPPIRIIGPVIETSKFYIEEETCREMFSQLIASSCNSKTQESVHPAFPEMIKQLSPADGKFLLLLKNTITLPCVELYQTHKDSKITPYPYILFDFKGSTPHYSPSEELQITKTVENLIRLGLIIKNQKVIELNYDYNAFMEHWFCKAIKTTVKEGSTINMRQYRIELSVLGGDFVRSCV